MSEKAVERATLFGYDGEKERGKKETFFAFASRTAVLNKCEMRVATNSSL